MNSKNLLAKEYKPGRTYMIRLPHGEDLAAVIESFCATAGISTAVFTLIGALSVATIGIYDQKQQVYATEKLEKALEIINCTGNISLKDGKPFCHAHLILADEDGQTLAGHVLPGTTMFAGELHLQELLGDNLERVYDPTTGLALWDMGK